MSVPLYSSQFFLAKDATVGGPLTVPDGELWVVVQVLVYSGNTTSTDLSWSLTVGPSGATVIFLPFPDLKIGTLFFNGRVVLKPEQYVSWHSDSSIGDAGVDVYVGGFTLSLP